MTTLISALDAAGSGMEAQAARLRHLAENVANADTPGYRRKIPVFRMEGDGVALGRVRLDSRTPPRIHDPGHPLADASGHYAGSTVDLVTELADAREAQRSYEANLRVFDQARQMTQSLFDLIRR